MEGIDALVADAVAADRDGVEGDDRDRVRPSGSGQDQVQVEPVGPSNSPVVTIFAGGLKDGRESSAQGVEAYLPLLLCLRPRWNSATASSDACVARTVVMSGVEKLIGEVADL